MKGIRVMKKSDKKGFVAEFKEFITRGNVIDMAVGVIIGTAFTAIVTSLVTNIFNPIVGYLIGGVDFTDLKVVLPQVIPGTQQATIEYGTFIQQVFNFLITAFVVFCMIKFLNHFHRKKDEVQEEAPAEPEISLELQMLTEIRDLLKENSPKAEASPEDNADAAAAETNSAAPASDPASEK